LVTGCVGEGDFCQPGSAIHDLRNVYCLGLGKRKGKQERRHENVPASRLSSFLNVSYWNSFSMRQLTTLIFSRRNG
jgi:hypothetical protein